MGVSGTKEAGKMTKSRNKTSQHTDVIRQSGETLTNTVNPKLQDNPLLVS